MRVTHTPHGDADDAQKISRAVANVKKISPGKSLRQRPARDRRPLSGHAEVNVLRAIGLRYLIGWNAWTCEDRAESRGIGVPVQPGEKGLVGEYGAEEAARDSSQGELDGGEFHGSMDL